MKHIAVLRHDLTGLKADFTAWSEGRTVVVDVPIDGGRHRHRFSVVEAAEFIECLEEALEDARHLGHLVES